jgi:hypothetical protein
MQHLPQGRQVRILPHTNDRYGRTVAEVISDCKEIGPTPAPRSCCARAMPTSTATATVRPVSRCAAESSASTPIPPRESPRPEPGAAVLMRGPHPGKPSGHQPSTFTITVLTVLALGAVAVSRPSR